MCVTICTNLRAVVCCWCTRGAPGSAEKTSFIELMYVWAFCVCEARAVETVVCSEVLVVLAHWCRMLLSW